MNDACVIQYWQRFNKSMNKCKYIYDAVGFMYVTGCLEQMYHRLLHHRLFACKGDATFYKHFRYLKMLNANQMNDRINSSTDYRKLFLSYSNAFSYLNV